MLLPWHPRTQSSIQAGGLFAELVDSIKEGMLVGLSDGFGVYRSKPATKRRLSLSQTDFTSYLLQCLAQRLDSARSEPPAPVPGWACPREEV